MSYLIFDTYFGKIYLFLLGSPSIELKFAFNRSSKRKRGIAASNPLFIIPEWGFFHFPNKLSYGYLRFEIHKWENSFGKVEKKFCPVGCLSLVLLKNLLLRNSVKNLLNLF